MELSVAEINLIIEAYNEKQENEIKAQVAMNYQLAYMTAIHVGCSLNGKDAPTLESMYPDLFNQSQEQEPVNWAAIRMKEQMLDFAEQHNKKWKG